jgi:hypothetical protein
MKAIHGILFIAIPVFMASACENRVPSAGKSADAGLDGQSGGSSGGSSAGGNGGAQSAGGGNPAGGIADTGGLMSAGGLTGVGGRASMGGVSGTGGPTGAGGAGAASAGGGGANATGGAGSPDAGQDANISETGLLDDAATDGGGPSRADAEAGEDGNLLPSCEGIWFGNTSPPANYPVIYRATASATDAGLDAGLLASPVPSGPVAGAPFNQDNTVPAVEAYLADWERLNGYEGISTTAGSASCFSTICNASFTQSYCGLSIYSPQLATRGTWSITLYSQTGNVYRVTSGLVHMIPMPRNVLVTQQQIINAIVGQKFTYDCGGGSNPVVVVSSQDTFVIPPSPKVYVRPSPAVQSALEYRLAIPVQVTTGGSPWTVYVDAIDGSFLETVANFICS